MPSCKAFIFKNEFFCHLRYMSVLAVYIHVYHMCAGALGGQKRALDLLELESSDCELPRRCWELNSAPLRPRHLMFTSMSSQQLTTGLGVFPHLSLATPWAAASPNCNLSCFLQLLPQVWPSSRLFSLGWHEQLLQELLSTDSSLPVYPPCLFLKVIFSNFLMLHFLRHCCLLFALISF